MPFLLVLCCCLTELSCVRRNLLTMAGSLWDLINWWNLDLLLVEVFPYMTGRRQVLSICRCHARYIGWSNLLRSSSVWKVEKLLNQSLGLRIHILWRKGSGCLLRCLRHGQLGSLRMSRMVWLEQKVLWKLCGCCHVYQHVQSSSSKGILVR